MSISKRKRYKVLRSFDFTCVYCGRRPPEVVMEVDHVNPRSRGGSDDTENLVAACGDCNRGKSDLLPLAATYAEEEQLWRLRWEALEAQKMEWYEWWAVTRDAENTDTVPFPYCLYRDRQRLPITFDFDVFAAMEELPQSPFLYGMTQEAIVSKAEVF